MHDGLCEPTPGELAIHDRERLLTESDFVEIVERRDNAPNKVKCLGCRNGSLRERLRPKLASATATIVRCSSVGGPYD